MLNFAERTGCGAVIMMWSFLKQRKTSKYINLLKNTEDSQHLFLKQQNSSSHQPDQRHARHRQTICPPLRNYVASYSADAPANKCTSMCGHRPPSEMDPSLPRSAPGLRTSTPDAAVGRAFVRSDGQSEVHGTGAARCLLRCGQKLPPRFYARGQGEEEFGAHRCGEAFSRGDRGL